MAKVIKPNKLELLACSVSESDSVDGVLWDASTSYAKDQKVRYEHVVYQSLAGSNKGNKPSETWSGIDASSPRPWGCFLSVDIQGLI